MAESLQEHCHLGLVCPPTSSRFTVQNSGGASPPLVVASVNRALSAKLHYHVLEDGGEPVVLEEVPQIILLLEGHTELETVTAMLGKTVYYVPNWHEDLSGSEPAFPNILKCKFSRITGMQRSDNMEQYWMVNIELHDAESYVGEVLDVNQGTLTYMGNDTTLAEFRDNTEDQFTEWATTAPGTAAYLLAVTNSDGTVTWGYMGAWNNLGKDIDIYTNIGLTTRGWNGALPATGVKTPSSYEVREA